MKKFMSLALSLVMVLSLMTFGAASASASDFTDGDDITYKEAVDVINAIAIMDGYSDESFRPAATLTRGAAAKIICNMILGPTTASALPTSANPFPDVLSGSTFAGYIAYCTEQGIISGYADGNFRPGDPLSGYAFLKMLLGALGYDQEIEHYTGPNWKVNVAKQAIGIDIDDGLDHELDGSTTVTREEAALYAFNTLKADLVEYDAKTSVQVGDAVVNVGGSTAKTRTWRTSNSQANNIYNTTTTNGPIMQFGELYFDRLERNPGGDKSVDGYVDDAFGRPSTKWTWKGSDIGTYTKAVSVEYNGNVKANKIYADLGMSSSSDAVLYVNGIRMNNTSGAAIPVEISRGNDEDISKLVDAAPDVYVNGALVAGDDGLSAARYRIGDGTKVQVFRDSNTNEVIICAISIYGGKVTTVKGRTSKKDPSVLIDWNADRAPFGINGNRNDFETTDFSEDDVVWYTFTEADNEIKDMGIMEPIEGRLNRRTLGKNLTIDSNTYAYAKEVAFDDLAENTLDNKSDYIIYLDDNGYVLWVEESEFSAESYAIIERISIEAEDETVVSSVLTEATGAVTANLNESVWSGERVRLLTAAGSLRTLTLNESEAYRNDATIAAGTLATQDGGTNPTLVPGAFIDPDFQAGQIVTFTQQSDGTYKLKKVATVTGTAAFAIDDKNISGLGGLNADSETVFVVKDGSSYKRYVGIKNVPNVSDFVGGGQAIGYAYAKAGSTTAKIIFITNGDVQSTSSDITFIAAASASKLVTTDDEYYVYNAVVKGEITSISILADANMTGAPNNFRVSLNGRAADEWQSTILNNTKYDSDDFLTMGEWKDNGKGVTQHRAQGVKKVSGSSDEIRLNTFNDNNGNLFDLADDVKIFFCDGDDIERVTLSDVKTDKDDWIFYTYEDGEITNLFVVAYEADDDDVIESEVYGNGELEHYANEIYLYHTANLNTVTLSNIRAALLSALNAPEAYATASWNYQEVVNGRVATIYYDGIDYTIYVVADAGEERAEEPVLPAIRDYNANLQEEAPAAETQSAEETPVEETPAVETPAETTPVEETPAEETTPVEETPAEA